MTLVFGGRRYNPPSPWSISWPELIFGGRNLKSLADGGSVWTQSPQHTVGYKTKIKDKRKLSQASRKCNQISIQSVMTWLQAGRHEISMFQAFNHSWAPEYISDAYSIDLIAWRRLTVCSRNVAIHIRSDKKWLHFTFDAFKIIDNETSAQRHMQNQTNRAFIIRVFLHLLLHTVVWF